MILPENTSDMERNINTPGRSRLIIDNAGKADYNINNLEQQYVVGHNRVRNTFANRFTMSVAEANGVTLLDTIRRSAAAMGIVDHKQAVYILVIEFNGRKQDGLAHKHPQVFYYPVKIVDFQFKVDEGGTNYNITAIENSTSAYSYLNNVIKTQITIVAATVGEFFELFNQAANQAAADAIVYSVDQIHADTFDISFNDSISDWKQWQFQALNEEITATNVNIISAGVGAEAKLQVTISNGSNLTDVVNIILSQTAEYKQIVLNSASGRAYARNQPDQEVSSSLAELPVFHKVISNVTYGAYDWLRGDYTRHNEYQVIPYIIADEILSPESYISGITDAGIQSRRVRALMDNDLLRKRYDYIFTGANTEVLEFDIKIDHAYYHTTPYGGGQLGDPNVAVPVGALDSDTPVGRLISRFVELRSNIASLQTNLQAENATLRSARSDGPQAADQIRNSSTRAGNLQLQLNQLQLEFNVEASRLNPALEAAGMSSSQVAMALRFAQDVISDTNISGSDNDNTGGHLKFGSLITNIENSADLMSIELGIRGDPYWLGKPNSFYDTGLQGGNNLANFEKGSNGFYLKCMLPYPFEGSDGRRQPSTEYEISGFYTVVDVITRYTGGQFTMYLNAVRDLGTNTPTAESALNNDSGVNTAIDSTQRQAGVDAAAQAEQSRPTQNPHIPSTQPFQPTGTGPQ
jgi:hypothetical protein